MTTLAEIEAAFARLLPSQQEALYVSLSTRLRHRAHGLPTSVQVGRHVLDIAPVSVGEILAPPLDGDLLGEMLEGRV